MAIASANRALLTDLIRAQKQTNKLKSKKLIPTAYLQPYQFLGSKGNNFSVQYEVGIYQMYYIGILVYCVGT
jgi:hypothetical protein